MWTVISSRTVSAVLLFAALCLPASAQQAQVEYLRAFVGDWRGQGQMQITPSAEVEDVVCRARGDLTGPVTLQINGRCGSKSFTGSFGITAQYDPSINGYQAVFNGPPTIGSIETVAFRSGDDLEIELRRPGQPVSFLTISRRDGVTFRLRADTTTGPTSPPYTSADIAMRRE